MGADGRNQRRLTFHPSEDWLPHWSPSGRWIIFTSDRSGEHQIYKISFDGSDLRRLTDSGLNDQWAAWSSVVDMPFQAWGLFMIGILLSIGALLMGLLR